MKQRIFQIALLIAINIFYCSCVDPDFEINSYQSEIVIDGWIEQDKYCQVLLTLSAPYFSDIDSLSLRDYSLTRAKVTLSCEDEIEVLTLAPNTAYFPPYIYKSTSIKGEVGKTYFLQVDFGGISATSETTIPEPVKINRPYFKVEPDKDSLGYIWIQFKDNANNKDYYRTLTQIKHVDSRYIPNHLANFNDEYFNGKDIEVALYKGNNAIDRMDNFYYQIGDTISLKFTTIDKASYEFWYSFQKETMNTGNPFASTNARIKSNVSNGLGIWCGYGASYYKVIAK